VAEKSMVPCMTRAKAVFKRCYIAEPRLLGLGCESQRAEKISQPEGGVLAPRSGERRGHQ